MKISLWLKLTFLLLPYPLVYVFIVEKPVPPITIGLNNSDTSVYSDEEIGGKSSCTIKAVGDEIVFQYKITTDVQFPYAGFQITPDSSIQITEHNEMAFFFESETAAKVPIYLTIEDHEWKDGRDLDLLLHQYFELEKGKSKITVKLSAFKFPDWWIIQNKVEPNYEIDLRKEKIRGVNFQCGQFTTPYRSEQFKVSPITFQQKVSSNLLPWILGIAGVDIMVIIIFIYMRTRRVKVLPVHYEPKKVTSIADEQHNKILDFIKLNYSEVITTEVIQRETGIPSSKITSLLKSQYDSTLKQFVTGIRIQETKRLLTETDLPVSEISDIVGFGNISHFNRVFKSQTGTTPLQYRKS